MGEGTATRLSILSKISNISVRYSRSKRKKTARKEWLEVRKELESVCGSLEKEEGAELRARLAEQEASARVHGLSDIPPPGEMTILRRKRR